MIHENNGHATLLGVSKELAEAREAERIAARALVDCTGYGTGEKIRAHNAYVASRARVDELEKKE